MTDPGHDFERRVTEALESGAAEAPDATGLATAARERNRRRVRTRTVGVVAATVLAVAAVPVTFALGRGDGSTSPNVVNTPTSSPTSVADPDSRTETYHDLAMTVPASWGYGSLATWCLGSKSEPEQPVVERPGGAMPAIGCFSPENGYGAQFFSTALFDPVNDDLSTPWQYGWEPGQVKVYPRDSWLGVVVLGDYAVRVVAPDEATARQVLDSVHTVEGADGNGCAVHQTGAAPVTRPGTVSVCRYAQDGWLEQSELLTGDDAADAAGAVAAVEPYVGLGPGGCKADPLPGTTVLLAADGLRARVIFGTGCFWDDGVFTENGRGLLTKDVMYWVLSPGFSGGFVGDVPLPERLRGQQ